MLASGNPVPWDIDAGARSRELVALLHRCPRRRTSWAAVSVVQHLVAFPMLLVQYWAPFPVLLATHRPHLHQPLAAGPMHSALMCWATVLKLPVMHGPHLRQPWRQERCTPL